MKKLAKKSNWQKVKNKVLKVPKNELNN